MKNKELLAALSSDLKRIAMGIQRKSYKMADRFAKEALARKKETDISLLDPYMQKILNNLDNVLQMKDSDKKAEYILMYSTLVQNYSLFHK